MNGHLWSQYLPIFLLFLTSKPPLQVGTTNLIVSFLMSKDFSCNACQCNKSLKLSFSTSTLISSHPSEIIFSDVWTSLVISHDGFKYYVIFVDHFTKYIWFYLLKQKSEIKEIFILFKALIENYFQHKIFTFYSDNGVNIWLSKTI